MTASESTQLDPQTRIGHVHLKVADLERAVAFYEGVLGLEVTERCGTDAAFPPRLSQGVERCLTDRSTFR